MERLDNNTVVAVRIPMMAAQSVGFDIVAVHRSSVCTQKKRQKLYELRSNIFWMEVANFNKLLLTLVPCHCILLHAIHCRHDVHDGVNQSLHSNQLDDHAMKHGDHFFVVYSSVHCLNDWKLNENVNALIEIDRIYQSPTKF